MTPVRTLHAGRRLGGTPLRTVAATTLLAGLVLVAGACSAKTSTSTAASTGPATSTSVAATTTAPTAHLTQADAASIGLQPADVNPSLKDVGGGGPGTHADPGPCTPVSSAPWLVNVSSPDYEQFSDTSEVDQTSQVVVMPDAATASKALTQIAAPTYAEQCRKPNNDTVTKKAIEGTNANMPCGLSLTSSSVAAIPSSQLPPGMVGTRYTATIHCAHDNTDSVMYRDQISGVTGPVYFTLSSSSWPAKPDVAAESAQLEKMAARAKAALAQ